LTFHPHQAVAAFALSIAALHSQAVVLQGSSFGARAEEVGVNAGGWYRPTTDYLTHDKITVSGSAQALNGQPLTLYVFGALSVSARSGAMVDDSHTMSFHWNLPQGWTYTPSSERFSAVPSPVPKPASMALVLFGLLGMAALERRRVLGCLWARMVAGLSRQKTRQKAALSRPVSS
jgi:hypothetical protein